MANALVAIAGRIRALGGWRRAAFAFVIGAASAFAFAPFDIFPLILFAYAALALPLSLLITWMHRENIRRLLGGSEPRIGAK